MASQSGVIRIVHSHGTTGIFRANATTGAATLFVSGSFDGFTVDSQTGILYAEGSSHVCGYQLSTGAQVFDSGFIADNPDGIAIGRGALLGNLYVNTNNGVVYELNIASKLATSIATGGSRGDFVSVDPNGSLLLTQSDSILRLTPGAGGTFSDTPEPATFAAALAGLGTLAYFRRRNRGF